MIYSATLALRAARIAPRVPTLIRAYRPTASVSMPTTSTASPASPKDEQRATARQHPTHKPAGKGNTTSPQASASEHNAPKDSDKDKMEAEAASAGPEAADAQYGGADMVEGNYTKGSKEAKDRKEAGKMGEH
ncbi:hypothetical protein JCM9279_005506 [Rhodotorula babjevae]